MKKVKIIVRLIGILMSVLIVTSLYSPVALRAASSTFIDVPENHAFYKAVQWAKDKGITGGYTGDKAGYFGVNDSVTRGQVVVFLWRAAGKPSPKKNTQVFSDVPTSHSFYKAIQWANEQGIAAGYTGTKKGSFGVNDNCTRGQIVTFLWRYADKPAPKKSTQTFSDVPTSHSFYKQIQWASEQGITSGYKDGTFGVNKTCTRGHCVTFLYRLIEGKSSGSGSGSESGSGSGSSDSGIALSEVDPETFYVWVAKTGTKFHSTSTCSNMNNPTKILLKEALAKGRSACSKCWRHED